jgi:hypothetical protein
MTRGLTVASAFVMAGMVTIAAVQDAGAFQGDASPFHVRVADAQRKGVPKIAVEVMSLDQPRRSFATNEDGRVAIPAGVVVEGAVLSAARGRDALAWAQVDDPTRAPGSGTQGNRVEMRLLPLTHRVEGSVVDRQGKPIAGVRIGVQSLVHPMNGLLNQDVTRKEPLLGFVESDQAGKFSVTLPQGTRTELRALHPRFVGPAIAVSANARTLGPATLSPAGGIAGKLTDATTGKPVAGAAVAVQLIERPRRMLTDGWGQSVTDDQGRFVVVGLEPGVYNVLLLEVPGRSHATATAVEGLRVNAGSEAMAALSVIEGHPLHGVVIDRGSGRPMAGAQVGCHGPALPQSGAGIMGTKTDEQGRFTFHVPPGEQFVYLIDDLSSSRMTRRVVVVPEQGDVIPLFLLQPSARSFVVPPLAELGVVVDAPAPAIVEFVAPAVVPPPPVAVAAAPPPVAVAAVPAPAVAAPVAPAPAVTVTVIAPAPAVAAPAGMTVETKTAQAKVAVKAGPPAVGRRTVTGRVRDTKGRPLAGIRVADDPGPFRPANLRDQYGSAATDREGTFVLGEFLRRQVPITLSRPRYQVQAEIVPADRDEVELTYRLQPDEKARNQAALIEDESIPPDLRPRLTFVDLTPYGTNFLTDGPAAPGDGNNLDRLPRGVHKLGDSYFRIGEKMVQVKGQASPDRPESVAGIKVAARGTKLHILHATEQQTEPGTELGNYVVHYADGSREKIPIVYGRNLVDWWHFPSQKNDPSGARIAWTGTNEMSDQKRDENLEIRLFAFTWTNPQPDREIVAIDVVSSNSACDPYLIAVTLERSAGH